MRLSPHTLAALLFASGVGILLQLAPDPLLAQVQELPPSGVQDSGPQKIYQPSYKLEATLVNVDVMVTDEDGRVLTGLKGGNFHVLDNGSPQKLESFTPTSEPITIVILMEYSAHSYSYFAGKAADWGTAFLKHLDPNDWVSLVTFDMRSKVQVDFTHRQYDIRDAIGSLGSPQFSEANFYDALTDTLDKLDGVRGRKAVLLLTTGMNTFSAATLNEVYRRVRQTDAILFCVGLAESEYQQSGGSSLGYLQGRNSLETFARQTGGLAYFPRFSGELPDIFRSVVVFLRSEYTLTFRPPKESRDGLYHRLKVEIVGPDGKPLKVTDEKGRRRKIEVHAREGYIAPKN